MHLIRCDATMKPTLPTRISDVLDKFKFNDRSALWDIFGKLNGTSTAPQNKQILNKSRSKSRSKHFEILQPYFNTCISHISKKILIFLLASRRTSNQLPNIATTVSPTNGKTPHNSRSTYAKRIEITRLKDVFTELVT